MRRRNERLVRLSGRTPKFRNAEAAQYRATQKHGVVIRRCYVGDAHLRPRPIPNKAKTRHLLLELATRISPI
jgi:hypothetical protein